MTTPQTQAGRRTLDFGDLPPAEWFDNPNLPMLTPFTITREGRVFGHLAGWGVPHRGLAGTVFAPRSRTNYARFVNKTAVVAGPDGQPHMIPAANLTMGTKHAPLHSNLAAASDHYDHSGTIIAQVAVFEDEHGIAYSGAVLPDVTPAQIRRALACAGSGDWRRHEPTGNLELCAALLVPCEGFEQTVPRARVASGAPQALVAAGMVPPRAAAFGRAVDPAWQAARVAAATVSGALSATASTVSRIEITPDGDIRFIRADDEPTESVDLKEQVDILHAAVDDVVASAEHAALLASLDDTADRAAALLAELDDTQERVAALLAALDDEAEDDLAALGRLEKVPGVQNWIDRLSPAMQAAWHKSIIYRAAIHMHEERGMSVGHAIASAINWCRAIAATGDVKQWKGPQSVNPKSRAECVAALALWESMKAAAKAD